MLAGNMDGLVHQLLFLGWGAAAGSFAAVAIYRWPRGFRVTLPRRSYCLKCWSRLRWWENIPVLGYFFLRGRCNRCKKSFGVSLLVYECLMAFLFWAVALRFGPSWQALSMAVFCWSLVVASFVDIEFRIIPDEVSLGMIPIGLLMAIPRSDMTFFSSALGLILGGGSLWFIAWLYKRYSGQDGLGLGDIKLLALFGTFLGPVGAVMSMMLGSVVGAMFGLVAMVTHGAKMKTAFPFGPFLALGALLVVFWGHYFSPFFFGEYGGF